MTLTNSAAPSRDTASVRQPDARDKQIAKEGMPLDVEFQSGRIDPRLEATARRFLRDYESANKPANAVPALSWLTIYDERDVFAQADAEGRPLENKGYAVEEIFPIPEDASPAACTLIGRYVGGLPMHTVDRSRAPGDLFPIEARVDAVDRCRMLRARMGHLFEPVRDAIVHAATMADIGKRFGGNSASAPKVGREKVIDGLWFAEAAYRVIDDEVSEIPPRWRKADNDNRRAVRTVA